MPGEPYPNPFSNCPIPHSSQSRATGAERAVAGGMEEDDKKASGCGLLVLYNTVFRRRPEPVSPGGSANFSSLSGDGPPSSVTTNCSIHNSKCRQPAVSLNPATMSPTDADQSCRSAPRPWAGSISTDLDSMIYDHQRAKRSSTLVRASSGNVMLYGNLGNLRAPGAITPNRNVLDFLPKTAKEIESAAAAARRGAVAEEEAEAPVSMCRALSRRLDPKELKEMGNEEYKNGKYAEAVALYDRAILIDPDKASYWSNKAAALMGLGRLLDAVQECREAVRIDPCYFRAHQRLATLYIRLGEPERAANHCKLAKNEASSDGISRVKTVQVLIGKCSEARKARDWKAVLKESQSAISAGVDSAPQIFAYQAEAYLMLRRQEDAEESMIDAPKFEINASTKFFGAPSNAYQLSVKAQVDMAAGRFESAVSLAQMAARIDPSSREISTVARKVRSVASARLMGNDLFKASKFEEACLAYGDGLSHEPQNAILLCNRAACRSKLGQWKKAIEDCNVALNLRPKYSKARLRRADCNVKLERWEASTQDYEVLVLELVGDETVNKGLQEAKAQLRRQQGEGAEDTTHCSDVVHVTRKDQFDGFVTLSGEFGSAT